MGSDLALASRYKYNVTMNSEKESGMDITIRTASADLRVYIKPVYRQKQRKRIQYLENFSMSVLKLINSWNSLMRRKTLTKDFSLHIKREVHREIPLLGIETRTPA
jgi:hypothetical protein